MTVNADKPHLWKADVTKSVEQFNDWFIKYAPEAFQKEREKAGVVVEQTLVWLNDLFELSPASLRAHPDVITTLRMATAPPLARDRLIGLAGVPRGVITALEKGRIRRGSQEDVAAYLDAVCGVLEDLLDFDIFPWLEEDRRPTRRERELAAVIIGDRLTGANADPLIRNAQEARQLAVIEAFLTELGYEKAVVAGSRVLAEMAPGTFAFRMNVVVGKTKKVKIPVDVVIKPRQPTESGLPVLIEAKSAGDFTNTNKRRKEEATKLRQLRDAYGQGLQLVLFLCGYFDEGYLGYEAAEGLDWVWEHRVIDLLELGI